MLEHQREFACILAFDVSIPKDVREYADTLGVRIFEDLIIYHLFDMFTAYIEEVCLFSLQYIYKDFFIFLTYFFNFFLFFVWFPTLRAKSTLHLQLVSISISTLTMF